MNAPREPWGEVFARMSAVDFAVAGSTVLDHVDLEVHHGELLALVGSNGAGKSSVLRCLAGVWRHDRGEITVDGLDRFDDDLAIRRFTAYLPPEPPLLRLTLRENAKLLSEAYGIPDEVFRERLDALLRMFDLKELQDRSARDLSKGEGKKAALACVLLTGARFFLLDEPFTGGIDPRGYRALMRVMDRLAANRDITVVFATQILELAENLADRIAVVNRGRILACGTPAGLRLEAGLEPDAPFGEVFELLASHDTEVPIRDFLDSLGGPR